MASILRDVLNLNPFGWSSVPVYQTDNPARYKVSTTGNFEDIGVTVIRRLLQWPEVIVYSQ